MRDVAIFVGVAPGDDEDAVVVGQWREVDGVQVFAIDGAARGTRNAAAAAVEVVLWRTRALQAETRATRLRSIVQDFAECKRSCASHTLDAGVDGVRYRECDCGLRAALGEACGGVA